MTYTATLFTFELQPDETVGDRIVRCCSEALSWPLRPVMTGAASTLLTVW